MSEFAGTLTQRIEIWRRSDERLASGASTEVLEQLSSCHACVVSDGAGPITEAMSVSAMPRYRILVRTQREIAVDQQVRWKGRRLLIRQIVEDPLLPDRMTLRCEEQR